MADTGKWVPLDYRSSELNGNLIVQQGLARKLDMHDRARALGEGYELYTDHRLTCPESRMARRSQPSESRRRVPRPRWQKQPPAPPPQQALFP